MVPPPRPKTGPFLTTGVDLVVTHAPGMAPEGASDLNVDPTPAPGLQPVDAIAPGVKPVVDAQCLGPSLSPGSSPVIAHVSVKTLLPAAVFLCCAADQCYLAFFDGTVSFAGTGLCLFAALRINII